MGFGHERLDVYRAAIDDVGWAYRFCDELKGHRKATLDRIVAMLTKLGHRGVTVREDAGEYRVSGNDSDSDSDSDSGGNHQGDQPTRRGME